MKYFLQKTNELFHINNTCTTPEKMAFTLLDYLFDRETQACSNISGTGKHRKRQLDPLMVSPYLQVRNLTSRLDANQTEFRLPSAELLSDVNKRDCI
ncbi:protein BANP-like isoform X4 [Tachypleus tridentatus]|uniref:protein BANP-like isoform X4 n=1 Tax=Tachypleus tridentatus TaxID=6853 RepID=UPI003FD17385